MTDITLSQHQLGWKPYFQQQLTLDELTDYVVARVIEQHRSHLIVMSDLGSQQISYKPNVERICVGDWLLIDENSRVVRVLERQSLFERKAPGTKVDTQLIAANIDTVMIVCSLNHDFKLSRIERYMVIANEAEVEPVIVLTKADLCEDVTQYQTQVQALDPLLMVIAVNATDPQSVQQLAPFCQTGKTVAFMGSSGVGKSTLVNSLLGSQAMATGSIREDDSKGKHTTTHRAIKLLPQGGILMDTPGMRELQLSSSEHGVNETFNEISTLASQCRFNNCSHQSEPGCAVLAAIDSGELSQRRMDSYQKLMREQAFNSATLAEKRSKDKALGKMINTTQLASRRFKKGS